MLSAPMTAMAAMPTATIPMMLPDAILEEVADVDNVDRERTDAGNDEVNGRFPNVYREAGIVIEVVGEAMIYSLTCQYPNWCDQWLTGTEQRAHMGLDLRSKP